MFSPKINFQRASKTDKNVSAVGQVCNVKIPLSGQSPVENINEHLPRQIRILVPSVYSFQHRVCPDYGSARTTHSHRLVATEGLYRLIIVLLIPDAIDIMLLFCSQSTAYQRCSENRLLRNSPIRLTHCSSTSQGTPRCGTGSFPMPVLARQREGIPFKPVFTVFVMLPVPEGRDPKAETYRWFD
nr:unnamed protein product [Spirometra erinaceieuropaei]